MIRCRSWRRLEMVCAVTLTAVVSAAAGSLVLAASVPDPVVPGQDPDQAPDRPAAGEAAEVSASDGGEDGAGDAVCRLVEDGDPVLGEIWLKGRVVMRLRAAAGPYPLEERCRIVAGRLAGLLAEGGDAPIQVLPRVMDGQVVVALGERVLVTVTGPTAWANGTSSPVLAWLWANQVRQVLGAEPLELEAVPVHPSEMLVMHASWYGPAFHGSPTASGEPFDQHALTAAHRTLPFGTILRVIDPQTQRQVLVRVNDRGPWIPGRDLDLSYGAARLLDLAARGVMSVWVEVVHRPDGQ